MRPSIPDLLTFDGGYVDTAGFLTLQGLFTAHVTGNFVTLGATLVQGSSGTVTKTLALPVFCAVIALARAWSTRVTGKVALHVLLGIKVALFFVAAALAIVLGPFRDADTLGAVLTGMSLVAAMAVQNAVQRTFFPKSPPTTLMTGSTTQLMMDVADLLVGRLPPAERSAVATRSATLVRSICVFAFGCGLAALICARFGAAVFFIPPANALITSLLARRGTQS